MFPFAQWEVGFIKMLWQCFQKFSMSSLFANANKSELYLGEVSESQQHVSFDETNFVTSTFRYLGLLKLAKNLNQDVNN